MEQEVDFLQIIDVHGPSLQRSAKVEIGPSTINCLLFDAEISFCRLGGGGGGGGRW